MQAARYKVVRIVQNDNIKISLRASSSATALQNIGTLSVQELFFQLIGWLGVELGVSPLGMVYFMG